MGATWDPTGVEKRPGWGEGGIRVRCKTNPGGVEEGSGRGVGGIRAGSSGDPGRIQAGSSGDPGGTEGGLFCGDPPRLLEDSTVASLLELGDLHVDQRLLYRLHIELHVRLLPTEQVRT